jgi:hypothetical protein
VCALDTPIMMQGAFYGYGDGTSCPASTPKPCTAAGCKMMGTTTISNDVDDVQELGLRHRPRAAVVGRHGAVKSVYTGSREVLQHHDHRLEWRQHRPHRFHAERDAGRNCGGAVQGAPVVYQRLDGPGLLRRRHLPELGGHRRHVHQGAGDGTPVDMQIQVSAGSTAATVGAFDLTLTKVEPVQSGSTGSGGSSGGGTSSCMQPSGSGTITQQFGDAHVMCPKDYIVQNNAWGSSAGQTVHVRPGRQVQGDGAERHGLERQPRVVPVDLDRRVQQPQHAAAAACRARSAQITAGSLQTSWTWADNGASGSYNAAYDVWFSTGAGGDPAASAPSGGYLMVWYYDPSNNQPIGATIPNGTVTIGGKQFNIWYGMNGNKPVVSYVAAQNFTSWSYSLGDFIQDAITRNCSGSTKCVNPSWYLTAVFAGFEIWSGGVGLETKDFGVTVP